MKKNLYEIFADRWCRGGTVWVYSDPHFNDAESEALRKNYIGDEEQVKRINSKVGKNDTIIFLGDLGDKEFIKRIRGYKVLIMGNHEKGASNYKDLFNEVYEGPLMVNNRLLLSHEPIEGLPKYVFNIHGHDHSKWYRANNALKVCAEHIDYTPLNLLGLIKEGLLKDVTDIHRMTIDHARDRKIKRNLKKVDKMLEDLKHE